jgi:hypothetical protein
MLSKANQLPLGGNFRGNKVIHCSSLLIMFEKLWWQEIDSLCWKKWTAASTFCIYTQMGGNHLKKISN